MYYIFSYNKTFFLAISNGSSPVWSSYITFFIQHLLYVMISMEFHWKKPTNLCLYGRIQQVCVDWPWLGRNDRLVSGYMLPRNGD